MKQLLKPRRLRLGIKSWLYTNSFLYTCYLKLHKSPYNALNSRLGQLHSIAGKEAPGENMEA